MARKHIGRAAYSADTKRTRKSGSSSAVAARRKRSRHKKAPAAASGKRLLSDRIQSEREQLFKAISIVECCKYASATLIEVGTTEYMDGVFDVLCEMLNSTAGELGCMVDECRGRGIPSREK